MVSTKYVVYLRVSTARQGRSGLGLEAQQAAVRAYLKPGDVVVKEVPEVESGKRSDRPALAEALSLCRLHRARLLVAKLDRLARNVHFISGLMESGVPFVAADMPEANELTVHIMAAMAEYERKAISERTRNALAAAKARGTKLGVHTHKEKTFSIGSVSALGRPKALELRRARSRRHAEDVAPLIARLRRDGVNTLREIAEALNAEGVPAPRGGLWMAKTVSRVLKLAEASSELEAAA